MAADNVFFAVKRRRGQKRGRKKLKIFAIFLRWKIDISVRTSMKRLANFIETLPDQKVAHEINKNVWKYDF